MADSTTTSVGPIARMLADDLARIGRLTLTEIAALDRSFRATPGMGVAWTWAFVGEIRYAHNYGYEALWDRIDDLKATLDAARAAVWAAALKAGVEGADDPGRPELERRWIGVRSDPTPTIWDVAAAEVLAAPGPTWGAALAAEAAILVFWGGHLDPDRALISPWEAVIEALPRWRPSQPPESWPWPWNWPP
jgi:hypothetical protein